MKLIKVQLVYAGTGGDDPNLSGRTFTYTPEKSAWNIEPAGAILYPRDLNMLQAVVELAMKHGGW